MKHPHVKKANKYANDIVSGKIDACTYVKQACQRYLDDLEKVAEDNYPYYFDGENGKTLYFPNASADRICEAEKICQFAETMPHVKGKWAGSLIVLEPWQCFVFCNLFGWLRKSDNLRRFREFYGEIPRKNSKSVMGAIIGNYMFCADGEPGAEVYSGATTLLQAHEVFRPSWMMSKKLPEYLDYFDIELGGTDKNPGNIYSMSTASRYEAVVGQPGDGASVHCGLVDEYHEHKDDILFDCLNTGMGARTQPMLVTFTTAGTNTSYPCFDKRAQIIEILSEKKINESVFGVVYTIDEKDGDDWTDFKTWKKANPNYNISVFEDFLKAQHRTAIQQTRKQNIIKCKHLNIWSNAGDAWMNMVEWDKAGDLTLDINDFKSDFLVVGLDLASKIDIASMIPIFKRDGHYYMFSYHYIPEERTKGEDMAHYAGWVHDGYLKATPGNRIDISRIGEDIRQLAKDFDLSGDENGGGTVANDEWGAEQLIPDLQNEGIGVVEVPQTVKYLSTPMKEIEALVKDGKFHHDNNPVTNWMFANVMVKEDFKANIFPRKEGAKNKIDGAVAAITAMSRAMVTDAVEYGDAASCFG